MSDALNYDIGISARDLGIKMDGTDETTTMKNIASYIKSNQQKVNTIYFPEGTIIISDTIQITNTKNRLNLVGNGTTIKLANNASAFNNHHPMVIVNGDNVDISGFNFDGNYDGNYYNDGTNVYHAYLKSGGNKGSIALFISSANNVNIHDCRFKDISWSSCDINTGSNINVYRNVFYNGAQDYVPVHSATNVKVYNNVCYFPSNHGIHAYSDCSNIKFERNTIIYDSSYKKKYLDTTANCAIFIDHNAYPKSEVSNVQVYNNTIISTLNETVFGIRTQGYPKNVDISSNSIDILKGIGIMLGTPNLGYLYISNNRITASDICIYYKMIIDDKGVDYDTKKEGMMKINNNFLSSTNNSAIVFYTEDVKLFVEKMKIVIENNDYINESNKSAISFLKIDDKVHIVLINEIDGRSIVSVADGVNKEIIRFNDIKDELKDACIDGNNKVYDSLKDRLDEKEALFKYALENNMTLQSEGSNINVTVRDGSLKISAIKGETLCNLAPSYTIEWTHAGKWQSRFLFGSKAKIYGTTSVRSNIDLKANKRYLVMVNVSENTSNSYVYLNNPVSGVSYIETKMKIEVGQTGIVKFHANTSADFTGINAENGVILRSQSGASTSGKIVIKDIMILEKEDYEGLGFVTGIKSAGENEKNTSNKYEIRMQVLNNSNVQARTIQISNPLRKISDLIYDEINDGVLIRRVGTRAYVAGDESLDNVVTDKSVSLYKLAQEVKETVSTNFDYEISKGNVKVSCTNLVKPSIKISVPVTLDEIEKNMEA